MKTPELFIPRKRLMIPLGLGHREDVEIISESKPMIASLGAVAVVKLHFPVYPVWEEDRDQTSGRLHVAFTDSDQRAANALVDGANQLTPYNTDGISIKNGENTVISYGVRYDDEVSIWWGVTTMPLDPGVEVDNPVSWIAYVDLDEARTFDQRRWSA